MDGEPSAYRRPVSRFTSMPSTQFSRKMRIALSISSMPVRISCVITGSNALSCSWPSAAAQFTVTSMPKITKQHWSTHSGITGFTLAGMMLEPAWRGGTRRSPKPERGPELSRRRSSAAFFRWIARFFSAADAAMYALMSVTAASGSGAAVTGRPVMRARWSIAASRNRRSAQIPVPMAVPPRLSTASCGTSDSSAATSIFRNVAKVWNSWPKVIGTASCNWVRPMVTSWMCLSARSWKARARLRHCSVNGPSASMIASLQAAG